MPRQTLIAVHVVATVWNEGETDPRKVEIPIPIPHVALSHDTIERILEKALPELN